MRKSLRSIVLAATIGLGVAGNAHAGIPVIDGANLGQAIQQVLAWGKQYGQMAQQISNQIQQYTQLVTTFRSMNGTRFMGMLANNVGLQNIMPAEFGQIMQLGQDINQIGSQFSSLSNSVKDFKNAANLVDFSNRGIDINSEIGKLLDSRQTQIAIDRVVSEEALAAGGQRTESIKTLMEKLNDITDQKDALDLQARIQVEQANIQNEQYKMFQLAELRKTQDKIMEMKMYAIRASAVDNKPSDNW